MDKPVSRRFLTANPRLPRSLTDKSNRLLSLKYLMASRKPKFPRSQTSRLRPLWLPRSVMVKFSHQRSLRSATANPKRRRSLRSVMVNLKPQRSLKSATANLKLQRSLKSATVSPKLLKSPRSVTANLKLPRLLKSATARSRLPKSPRSVMVNLKPPVLPPQAHHRHRHPLHKPPAPRGTSLSLWSTVRSKIKTVDSDTSPVATTNSNSTTQSRTAATARTISPSAQTVQLHSVDQPIGGNATLALDFTIFTMLRSPHRHVNPLNSWRSPALRLFMFDYVFCVLERCMRFV